MQLVAIAENGARLVADGRNGLLVEPANFLQHRFRQDAAHLYRARATLLQWSIIEIRVRICIQQFVRKLGGHRRIHRKAANRSIRDPA